MDSELSIGLLYPELLGTYGDRGNATVLAGRLRDREMAFVVHEIEAGTAVPRSLDIYLLGGGEDAAQLVAREYLVKSKLALHEAAQRGSAVLGVCAGFQLLGSTIETPGETLACVGLIDATTISGPRRQVGNVTVETDEQFGTLVGFENHNGVTTMGPSERRLGVATTGDGDSRDEGCVRSGMWFTYLHGPVLAQNPEFADAILAHVVGDLPPIPLAEAEALHEERLRVNRRKRQGLLSRFH